MEPRSDDSLPMRRRLARLAASLALCGVALCSATASGQDATDPEENDNPLLRAAEAAEAAAADSTRAAAIEDSMKAYTDSLIAANAGFQWFGGVRPQLQGDWQADVNKQVFGGKATATVTWLDGGSSTVAYGARQTSYRQQEREQLATNLDAGFNRDLGESAKLTVDFHRSTNEDTNEVGDQKIVIDFESSNATLGLRGGHGVGEVFDHAWGVRGNFEDVTQVNRGTNNDRNLAIGGASSQWTHEREKWKATARLGFEGSTGTRQLRGLDADGSAVRDTLGLDLEADYGRWFFAKGSADLVGFEEKRLDFARNASGVIDTLNADNPVGQETETQDANQLTLNARTRALPRTSLGANLNHSFTETRFEFSREGVVQSGRDQFRGDASFRYAAAGSLSANFDYTDAWNDRRTQASDVFRGRESKISKGITLKMNQELMPSTDFEILAKQTLDQNVNEEETNNNDRDRLVDRFDAKITSDAIPYLTMNVGATLSDTRDVSLAAERTGNNKGDRLIEVRGAYNFTPVPAIRFSQNYRLQIVFIDYHNSNDRDQFNKQGQLRNELDIDLPNGSTFGLEYSVDFRKTGQRDDTLPFEQLYFTSLRRYDHQVRASMRVPWHWLTFTADTQRGFLREERSNNETEEDRGQITMAIEGNKTVFKKLDLRMNVERVLQFGPRVRDEQKDYFVANTTVTVRF